MKKIICGIVALLVLTSCGSSMTSLVPKKPSKAPDYFSAWNIQGYVVNYDGPKTIAVMDEQHMFGKGKLENWCEFFPDFREDLIFVMDDSWAVSYTHLDVYKRQGQHFVEYRSKYVGHERIGQQLAVFYVAVGCLSEFCAVFYFVAQNIACRNMFETVFCHNLITLRSLSRTGCAENHNIFHL